MSIEERLRNLDTIYSSQSNNEFEGTIGQFSRKLDKIESKLAHIETIVQLQLDKVVENMSAQFLKEDINRDHIKKKLDIIHENVNNRLAYNEIKLDSLARSTQENNNFLRNKLQKLEDNVTSRISDIEVAISEGIVSLEEAKDACALTGNRTNDKLSDVAEKTILKYFTLLENKYNAENKKIVDSIQIMESNIKSSLNKSYEIIIDVEDNLTEFSNSIAEMGDTVYDKAEIIEKNTIDLAKMINMTRNDIQNGFRSMMVQIGKTEKIKMMGDSSEMLNEMDRKIENNFENVLLAQNIFMETCHRLQMDESQMENKIGDIFQKLLDTLDSKMLVGANDAKEITKVLKNLISSKNKPITQTYDVQYSNGLLKSMDQIQKLLISMESGINKTVEITQENIEKQNNLTWNIYDIRGLLQLNFDSNKLILRKFEIERNNTSNQDTEHIDHQINCIFNGINCTQDIFPNKHTGNDPIVFKDNNDKIHNQIYDIEVRTMTKTDEDYPALQNGSNEILGTRVDFGQDLFNDYNIEELTDAQRIEPVPE